MAAFSLGNEGQDFKPRNLKQYITRIKQVQYAKRKETMLIQLLSGETT